MCLSTSPPLIQTGVIHEFITEPKPKYGETRCYIRDPDGYIIEVGQSNPGIAYG